MKTTFRMPMSWARQLEDYAKQKTIELQRTVRIIDLIREAIRLAYLRHR